MTHRDILVSAVIIALILAGWWLAREFGGIV